MTDSGWTERDKEQIACVFGLGGGELEDSVWIPHTPDEREFVFHFWYSDAPEYAERDFEDFETVRTGVRDEMFGACPEILSDDSGVWTKLATFRNSGESECFAFGSLVTAEHCGADGKTCTLCEEELGKPHSYVYLGDGWAEVVYGLIPELEEEETEAEEEETGLCRRHGSENCIDPECDPFGVFHAELLRAEREGF